MYKVPFPPRLGAKRQGGELPVPTWIQNDLVDSEAMYSAFLQYLGQCSEEEQKVMKERVNMILHKDSEFVILGGVLIRPKKVYPSALLSVARSTTARGAGCNKEGTSSGGTRTTG